MTTTDGTRVAIRTCPLCEATCGLRVTLDDRDVVTRVAGDPDDVFSLGYLCPKGAALGQLQADPDRLRAPLVREGGVLREASWETAFERVAALLAPVLADGPPDAVGVYLGNPNVHTLAGQFYVTPLLKTLRTRSIFSASTVDQMPKHVSCGLLFGDPLAIPVPDLDRTDHLLMLGANPRMSNGSLCTAPDFPGRLDALRRRGGRLVVVDPRRSRTAARADRHVPIRPGGDVYLLFAIAHTLFGEGLASPDPRVADLCDGLDEIRTLAERFPPERVADPIGVPAATIRELARGLAAADRPVVYGRIGTTVTRFGTLASWLVDVCNVLIGALDREGGAMFPEPAHIPGRRRRRAFRTGRWSSRVRGLPEVLGELPAATLADEILEPGEGRIRALLTIGGNPVLSTPNTERLDRALGALDAMICVDPYVNATTRHADVILPPPGVLERGHYDGAFYGLSVRNVANWTPPTLPRNGAPAEWEIIATLIGIASGESPDVDPAAVDELIAAAVADRIASDPAARTNGHSGADLLAAVGDRAGPERLLDLLLRAGPYGAGFDGDGGDHAAEEALSLARLENAPHGVDLGPLRPRLPDVLATEDRRVHLAPPAFVADVERADAALGELGRGLVLVGRRHLRTNNSWMHNLPMLTGASELCTLQVHPEDAAALGLVDGGQATVRSRVGAVTTVVEVTDDVLPGVVSLPHGFGHDREGVRQTVARRRPGVSSNTLSDHTDLDPLSGTAHLNAVPVEVVPA